MQSTTVSHSEDDTRAIGHRLAADLSAGDIIALRGDLGAGKTRLVAGIAEGLGIERATVNSPTYVLVNEYPTPPGSPARARAIEALVHIDAYRLDDPTGLEDLGLDDHLLATSITVVEWPQRLGGLLPPPRVVISIDITGPAERTLNLRSDP